MNVFKDQKKFMQACGQSTDIDNKLQLELYKRLIDEEVAEFFESKDRVNTVKELIDIIVVTVGALYSLGIDPEEAWEEVVKSNNSKIDPVTGKVLKRDDGKVLKGPNYVAPNFEKFK